MPRLGEDKTVWRYLVHDPNKFDKMRVDPIAQGVKTASGRVRGTERWEIQSYLFDKAHFKSSQEVMVWLDSYLKGKIQTLLDHKAWDEWRRRFVNAYMQISKVEG
ncbi:MAG: hypothetical protein ABSD73_05700 [Candidatus Bathyarchaeia archaeon]|jgi:hypothetical protein